MEPDELEDEDEADLGDFLDAVFVQYGYDFRGYVRRSLQRRVRRAIVDEGLSTIAELREQLLSDSRAFHRFLGKVGVGVTEMFRDPDCFLVFRRTVVPFLRTYPEIKVWVAGCSTGEEAYSVAILLREEGLAERSLVYATDLGPSILDRARAGIYPAERMRASTDRYRAAGGQGSFSSYFTEDHGLATIEPWLRGNVHFAEHNLVADQIFGEMNVILCRNVLIYFARDLQNRTLALLHGSLANGGFLWLGSKESLRLTDLASVFDDIAPGSKIFRKKIDVR